MFQANPSETPAPRQSVSATRTARTSAMNFAATCPARRARPLQWAAGWSNTPHEAARSRGRLAHRDTPVADARREHRQQAGVDPGHVNGHHREETMRRGAQRSHETTHRPGRGHRIDDRGPAGDSEREVTRRDQHGIADSVEAHHCAIQQRRSIDDDAGLVSPHSPAQTAAENDAGKRDA